MGATKKGKGRNERINNRSRRVGQEEGQAVHMTEQKLSGVKDVTPDARKN